jgi:hypothetical protein
MENIETLIYALVDPTTCKVRYIGITTKSLERRLYKHIDESMYSKKMTHKVNWIKSLINNNRLPIIRKLAKVDSWKAALILERQLIGKYKVSRKLTNVEDYNEGGILGKKLTDEQRLEISKKTKAWYDKGNVAPSSKRLKYYDTNCNYLGDFKSITEASTILKFTNRNIRNVLRRKWGSYKGIIFTYYHESPPIVSENPFISKVGVSRIKPIKVIDLETNEITVYEKTADFAKALGISTSLLCYKRKIYGNEFLNKRII